MRIPAVDLRWRAVAAAHVAGDDIAAILSRRYGVEKPGLRPLRRSPVTTRSTSAMDFGGLLHRSERLVTATMISG
jgi:hypothetical protein